MIVSALIIVALACSITGATVQNDFYYHAYASSQSYENKPAGCCYNGALISPGKTFCADDKTAIQCVKSNFFWFPVFQMVENKAYNCTGVVESKTSCAPTHCMYKGKLAKLGSVIAKEINANDYKIVLCLKNGAVKTMSGMCVDKATGKNNTLCKDWGTLIKMIVPGPTGAPKKSSTKAPAVPAQDPLLEEIFGEVEKADEDMDQVTGEFEHFGVDNPRKFEEDEEI